MSEIGKARRLARLFNEKSGRMLCVPMDHGMQVGPIAGIQNPEPLIDTVVEAGVDAVIINPGLYIRYHERFANGPAIILRLDQTTMWRTGTKTGYADTHTRQVATVREAVQMGAEAVISYLFTCNNDPAEETRCFEICGAIASECREWGMVHVIEAMAAKGGFATTEDPDVVGLNCRIAGEMGADIIKTDWCGAKGFKAVAKQSLAPVAVAGGATEGDDKALFDFASSAVKNGAKGIIFGRNVFQRKNVKEMLSGLRDIVHG